jgi:hypothetical protein
MREQRYSSNTDKKHKQVFAFSFWIFDPSKRKNKILRLLQGQCCCMKAKRRMPQAIAADGMEARPTLGI